MTSKLMQIFIKSSEQFVISETDLILSGVSERCLCGSFMLHLRRIIDTTEFAKYFSDIEYNRNFDGKIKSIIDDNMKIIDITCDIIIHSRGQIANLDNLIAIEMKRDTHPQNEKDKDRIRLRALTKPTNNSETFSADGRTLPLHVCGYKLGIFYEISKDLRQIKIEYFTNGSLYSNYTRKF